MSGKRIVSLSKKIANWCQEYGTVSEEEYPAIVYGLQLIFNTVLKMIGILLIGAVIGRLSDVVICMLVFCSIRRLAGGYHARTHWGCFSAMLIPCLCPVLVKGVETDWLPLLWAGMLLYSGYEFFRYAPRNSRVNPITDQRILRRKRIGCIVEYMTIAALVCICKNTGIRWLLIVPLFFEAVTVAPIIYNI